MVSAVYFAVPFLPSNIHSRYPPGRQEPGRVRVKPSDLRSILGLLFHRSNVRRAAGSQKRCLAVRFVH